MFENCWSEGKIGSLTLKNRFVMPGMGVNFNSTFDDEAIAWYEARAKGGFGLIVTEFNAVNSLGKGTFGEVVSSDDEMDNYKKLTEALHRHGAKVFMQIHHAGRQTSKSWRPGMVVGPTAIPCPKERAIVHELTTEEVYEIIDDFATTALRAKNSGFDGIEIHGGHGYLVAGFLSLYSNKRTDEFGGDILGRSRFATEIIRKIKETCGADFPISFRISYDEKVEGGRRLNETVILCKLLEKAGVDAFNVSVGTYGAYYSLIAPYFEGVAYNVEPARVIKGAVKVPVMAVGRLNDPVAIDSVIEDGYCDFVLMGRGSIADPAFPNKVKEGRTDEICPCVGCMTRCQGMPGSEGFPIISCAMNPFAHRELDRQITPVEEAKNVVVIGAGPGGLNAAWVAAARGHKVTLFEKSGKLGGQMLYAMMPPAKGELARAIKYFGTMCKKYGVDIRLNTEVNAEEIKAMAPDAVIVATGATPIVVNLPNDGAELILAQDILSGKVVCGDNCLVIGGGLVGLETAEFIVSQNCHADVVEMKEELAEDQNPSVWHYMHKYLVDNGTKLMTGTKVKKFIADGAECENEDGSLTLGGYDMLVLALGSRPYNPFEGKLEGLDVRVVGDAVGDPDIANIRAAVEAGVIEGLDV